MTFYKPRPKEHTLVVGKCCCRHVEKNGWCNDGRDWEQIPLGIWVYGGLRCWRRSESDQPSRYTNGCNWQEFASLVTYFLTACTLCAKWFTSMPTVEQINFNNVVLEMLSSVKLKIGKNCKQGKNIFGAYQLSFSRITFLSVLHDMPKWNFKNKKFHGPFVSG